MIHNAPLATVKPPAPALSSAPAAVAGTLDVVGWAVGFLVVAAFLLALLEVLYNLLFDALPVALFGDLPPWLAPAGSTLLAGAFVAYLLGMFAPVGAWLDVAPAASLFAYVLVGLIGTLMVGPSALPWAAIAWVGLWFGQRRRRARSAGLLEATMAEQTQAATPGVLVLPGQSLLSDSTDVTFDLSPPIDPNDMSVPHGLIGRPSSW